MAPRNFGPAEIPPGLFEAPSRETTTNLIRVRSSERSAPPMTLHAASAAEEFEVKSRTESDAVR
jgi:hypothetical protein